MTTTRDADKHLRINRNDTKAGRYLADGNAAKERGMIKIAERLYARAQVWHDRSVALREKPE